MSAPSEGCSKTIDLILNPNGVKTRFWGVSCETGLKYNQVVERKYCITQAVLDPYSPCTSDYVLVMFSYNDSDEYILAALKYGQIQQVNLNMHFDRENVSFFLKGRGTVHLLGYEIIDSSNEVQSESNPALPRAEEAEMPSEDKRKKKSEGKSPKSSSGNKRDKHSKQYALEEEELKSPKASTSKDFTSEVIDLEDEDSEDEDDEDFSVEEEEEEDDEDSDDDLDDEIEDSEVEKLEEDLEDILEEMPEPSSSRKRKPVEAQQTEKRQKTETGSAKKGQNSVPVYAQSSESSESDSESADDEKTPSRKNVKELEEDSAKKLKFLEKMKKKQQKLKKLEEKKSLIKLNKSQQTMSPTSKKLENGLEITDIKVGHGPLVTKGKMIHVYFVGRLDDKTIFDSRTRDSKPFSFVHGVGKVIKGWEIGLEGMRAGGKRKLKVPPQLAYGRAAMDGIPANSTLHFVVEVIAVN